MIFWDKIIRELETWKDLPLSLFGRANLFKIASFSKLLYPLQTIPLVITRHDISRLYKVLSNFLWRSKRPRLALHKLWLPRGEVGLNLPNIKIYNLTCLLHHAMYWLTYSSIYSKRVLENAVASPWDPVAIIHTPLHKLLTFLSTTSFQRHNHCMERH